MSGACTSCCVVCVRTRTSCCVVGVVHVHHAVLCVCVHVHHAVLWGWCMYITSVKAQHTGAASKAQHTGAAPTRMIPEQRLRA